MYHTLSGSLTDGFLGRTGNSSPSTSWITVRFASSTVAAERKAQISIRAPATNRALTTDVKKVHNLVNRHVLSNNYDVLVGRDPSDHQAQRSVMEVAQAHER